MLKPIHQTLVENKIYSSYLRGNAYMKNAQVKYFKRGYDMNKNINQIIMLSLKIVLLELICAYSHYICRTY